MDYEELAQIKEKYSELLRNLHENIRSEKITIIKETIQDLAKKTFLLKRKLELN